MNSKSIFENLRALEDDQLRFPTLEYNSDHTELIVSANSALSWSEIDAKIKLAMADDFSLTVIDKKEYAQHQLQYGFCRELIDVEYNGWTDYYIEYRMEARVTFDEEALNDFYIPSRWITPENPILKENTVLDYPHGVPNKFGLRNDSCPDCKDGFYYPLLGPPEPCRTCK